MRLRVVCGLGVTIASFSPTIRLSSVDLPTLGRPRMATVPATAPATAPAGFFGACAPWSCVRSFMGGLLIAQMSCYPEVMCSPVVRRGLLAGLLALAAPLAARAATADDASAAQVATAADGALEVRQGASTVVLRLQPRTAALRRGTPRVHLADVDGHAIVDVRLPVR